MVTIKRSEPVDLLITPTGIALHDRAIRAEAVRDNLRTRLEAMEDRLKATEQMARAFLEEVIAAHAELGDKLEDCEDCDGKGELSTEVDDYGRGLDQPSHFEMLPCERCHGSGKEWIS